MPVFQIARSVMYWSYGCNKQSKLIEAMDRECTAGCTKAEGRSIIGWSCMGL
jgi:hypothetical protein